MIQSIQKQKPFSLFACCLLVQGIGRSLIVDVQRNKMHFIPNSLYLILSECNGMTLNAIIQTYGEENQAYIMDYFDFLSKEELIFFTNSPTRFPKLNLTWEQQRMITNGIIDILLVKAFDIQLVINQFSVLACHALQLRFFAQIKLEELECILDYFENNNKFAAT